MVSQAVNQAANLAAGGGLSLDLASDVDETPTWFKTARIGETLFLVCVFVSGACALGLYFGATPLPLFVAAATLPIAIGLAVIFNDPYYEDPIKRECYRKQIDQIGLEAFIEQHGWEKLERYGFCFYGRSPLITKEAYTKAFFQAERSIDSPLLWRGLERDLFLSESYDKLADGLVQNIDELIKNGRFWIAVDRGLFSNRCDDLKERLCQYLRKAEGYDILLIWEHLQSKELVPATFPLQAWASRQSGKIAALDREIREEKEALYVSRDKKREALKKHAYEAEEKALSEATADHHFLKEIAQTLENELFLIEQEYAKDLQEIVEREGDFRQSTAEEFEKEKRAHALYFTFDDSSFEELATTFGLDAIEASRSVFGFPSNSDWSRKFLNDPNPPIWAGLKIEWLDDAARVKAKSLLLSTCQEPWDLVDSLVIQAGVDAGLFEDKKPLLGRLSQVDPLTDPIRALRSYDALAARELIPNEWRRYAWLGEFGPRFKLMEHYAEEVEENPFLLSQKERWQRELLQMIHGIENPGGFEADLAKMPLTQFVSRYGWECITQLCEEPFIRRFFAEFLSPKEQLSSGLLWPLAERGRLSGDQKKAIEQALLADVAMALACGDLQQGLALGFFADQEALRRSIDNLDPKAHRKALLKAWPWLKSQGFVGDLLSQIAPWFERAASQGVDEKSFDIAYRAFIADRDWKHKKLADWAATYGREPFLQRMLSVPQSIDRWEKEDPTWSSDKWNWMLFDLGLLDRPHISRWMQAWIARHPTFCEKIQSKDFIRAVSHELFSDEDLKKIADSANHPTTFLFADEVVAALDWIESHQVQFTGKEKLLYNWVKDHRSWRDTEKLNREFTAYKKQIGWDKANNFDFDLEKNAVEAEEHLGLLRKVFHKE